MSVFFRVNIVLLYFLIILNINLLSCQSDINVSKLDTSKITHKKVNGTWAFEIFRPIYYVVSFDFTNKLVKTNFDDIVLSLEESVNMDSILLRKAIVPIDKIQTDDLLHVYIGEDIPLAVLNAVLTELIDDEILNFTINLVMKDFGSHDYFMYAHRKISLSTGLCRSKWNHRRLKIHNSNQILEIINFKTKESLIDYFKKNHENKIDLSIEEQRLGRHYMYWLDKYNDVVDFNEKIKLSWLEIEKHIQENIISQTYTYERKYKKFGIVLKIDEEGNIKEINLERIKQFFTNEELQLIENQIMNLPSISGKEIIGSMVIYLNYYAPAN